MTDRPALDNELKRLLDTFFADGSNELADRVVEAALDEIDITQQRPAVRGPRRFFDMTMLPRVAAAAAIAVVVVGGAMILSRPNQSTITNPSPPPLVGSQTIESPRPSAASTPSDRPSPSGPPARPASWTAVDPMHFAHWWGTAVRLTDGRVLMVGGDTTGRAEIFNPATGAWSPTKPMPSGHGYQTTALLDDRVLVTARTGRCCVSGNPPGLASALFDPSTGFWTATGAPRTLGSTAVLLEDGRVLAVGSDNLDDVGGAASIGQIYDPQFGAWTATASMNEKRLAPTATRLRDATVLVVGGTDGATGTVVEHNPLATAEVYDPSSGSWTETGAMSVPRYGATATLLADGRVLVAGGDTTSGFRPTAEIYDPATRTWTSTGSMIVARGQHTATLLLDGTVLVTGGDNGQFLSSAERFDPLTGTWSATAEMPAARSAHTATLLVDRRVLIAGGYIKPDTIAFVYDPGTQP